MKKSSRVLYAVFLILFAFALMLVEIPALHIRADENLVYDFTDRTLPELVNFLAESDVHPPLWFSSFWVWRGLVGDSEWAARVYGGLTGLVTLALVYQIGRCWFGLRRYGLLAVALLAVNAFFVVHALEIRPYSLNMLLATYAMWSFERLLRRRTWRAMVWYALSLALMMYVHYFLIVLVIAQLLYFVFYWLRQESGHGHLLGRFVGAAAMAFLLWLPWAPSAVYQVMHLRQTDMEGGNARGLIGSGATTIPTSWRAVEQLIRFATNDLGWLYGLILIAGLFALWRFRTYWLGLVWAVLAPAISMSLNFFLALYLPRYVVYMVVGVVVSVSSVVGRLPLRWLLPAMIGLVLVTWWQAPARWPDDRVPHRDVFQEVSRVAKAEDVVFFDRGGIQDGLVRAQIRRYMDSELAARRVNSIQEALQYRRIWYVSDGEWFTDEARARFAQIEATHPLQQVIGDCNREWCYLMQLMETAPMDRPAVFGDVMGFRGVDVDAVTSEAVHLRLWWQLESPIELDYSLAVHLRDMNGGLIAQSDSAIVDFYTGDLVQTSQLEIGKLVIDQRVIPLPPDLPAGEYQLVVLVYQWWNNAHLLLSDGSAEFHLPTITIE